MENFFTIFLALFFAIDAIGIIPSYLEIIKKCHPEKRMRIAIRELVLALLIMLLFYYLGSYLLNILSLTLATVQVSSGIVLFLIALRLIFHEETEKNLWGERPPFIVPIATPLFAGPSVLAVIMLLSNQTHKELSAIFLSWFISSIILFFASPIYKLIGEKGIHAFEKLMGLVIALIAVESFLEGLKTLITSS